MRIELKSYMELEYNWDIAYDGKGMPRSVMEQMYDHIFSLAGSGCLLSDPFNMGSLEKQLKQYESNSIPVDLGYDVLMGYIKSHTGTTKEPISQTCGTPG